MKRGMDNFHANGDRLYSVFERQYYDGKIFAGYFTPGVLPDEMKKVFLRWRWPAAPTGVRI
jgi:putative ABC transport system permease protein